MKALTFPEFFALKLKKKIEYYKAVKGYPEHMVIPISSYHLDKWYHTFTQQPFKPELIAELFQYRLFGDNYKNVDGYFYIYVSGREIEIDTGNETIDYGNYYVCGIPRTIDEFISDCRRAGIELKWRIK